METKNVVIITGAAGGIGRATAVKFAEANVQLVLSDIAEEPLQALAVELKNRYDADCLPIPGDLAQTSYLEQLVTQTIQRFGRIDALVNNAAWRTLETLRTINIETWEKTLRVCLTAPVFLTKAVAQEMENRGAGGVVINVTSVMAARPSGCGPAYIAAKGALESLTAELAITYGRSGIRVVGIAPGYIDTELSNDYTDPDGENISTRLTAELTDYIPSGRGGNPREVAEAIFWLCSPQASYISGTTLTIDGGLKPNFNSYSTKHLQFPNEF
ncbi:SDR family NAD(P)-dependent oxidoreductase [Larkinella terrae]|uniref:SDR family oxidoreductase n=1 Tax=Larkinella terrae TaxID=2025311 RepID=A0A7K0EQI7_9BACT|nr:SDR family oxidoreductase [Larkinella terrae]MRS64070.1 SDR family oxidoreductase [Larkinella terrae]